MYKSYSELGTDEVKNVDHFSVYEIKTQEDKENIINSNRIVCVDIYANWCGPCKMTESSYAILAGENNQQGKCMLVKEDWNNKLSKEVQGLPTYIFYLDGQEIGERIVGADIEKVSERINLLKLKITNQYNTGPSDNLQGPQFSRNTIRSYKPQNTNEWQENNNRRGI